MLTAAVIVVVLMAGFIVWAVSRSDRASLGQGSGTSSDSSACGDRINVGADGDCTDTGSGDDASGSGSADSYTDDSSTDTETDASAETGTGELAPAGTLPYDLEGVWEGTVSQPNASISSWTVRLDLTAAKKRPGTMKMVELGCSSDLTVQTAGFISASLSAPVKDKDDPDDVCAELGTVTLLANTDGTLGYSWRDASNASNVAISTLKRVED